jgi:hypothetical protein
VGYVFDVEDETFWSPSQNSARIVMSQVQLLESIVGVPSGLVESMSDTVDVDLNKLRKFVLTVQQNECLKNESMRLCLAGVFIHLLAILICHSALPSDVANSIDHDYMAQASKIAKRHMKKPKGQA